MFARVTLVVLTTVAAACASDESDVPFERIAEWPHDPAAYTQGLVWADSVLYESTGRYGVSELRRVDLRTGRVLNSVRLGANRFGVGLALLDRRLFLLTWESHVGYVRVASTLAPVDSFSYSGEGWGLATDGTSLIMSDGSDSLRVLSPQTFQVQRVVHARYMNAPLQQLNELEFVDGDVLANIYQTDRIARIDPTTGDVREVMDFAGLYPRDQRAPFAEVMNGIASPGDGRLLLTGKLWPKMFEVRLRPGASPSRQ
jgi:glutamine cyclotransferase